MSIGTSTGPNTALALAFSGILGIYLECVRPGRAIAGCVGVALLLWGCYELWLYGPKMDGVLLLALATLLFGVEVMWSTRCIAGGAGTAALFAGLRLLLPAAHRIHFAFALSLALLLGSITTLLCRSAREARRNKWADLDSQISRNTLEHR